MTSARGDRKLTVLQSKFAAYLSWSQPFLHHLLTGVGEHVHNVVTCNRTENLARFPVKDVIRIPDRYLLEPRLAVLAAQYAKKTWNPDLIHAHFGWSGLRMLLLKQFLRIPMVVTFGGRDVGVQMQLEYFDRLYEVMLNASDQLICVSKDLRDKVLAMNVPEERVRVIYRGCDLERFAFVDRSARSQKKPVRILMVGRIVEKKGHEYAFQALAELQRRGIEPELVVVGEGEDYPQIKRLRARLGLRSQVHFAGSTDHEGVCRHMSRADLLLHCSVTPPNGDTEGIPNAVVEGQSTGLPVVGTRHGGIVEAVVEGETGFLVPERDVSALAEAVERLVANETLRLDMGRAAREFVARDFNLQTQVAEHVDIYRKLADSYASQPSLADRVWVPEDYAELVRMTIRNHEEFSVAELLERFIWARRVETTFIEPVQRESRLERLYDLKKYIPQMIKYPVKMMVGRTLAQAIEVSYRSQYGSNLDTLESMDQRVLSYFRDGGAIDVEDEQWGELVELLERHPKVGEGVEQGPTPEA
jgi:colanic acid/amylovoran biosynthesis glycosyltransferase